MKRDSLRWQIPLLFIAVLVGYFAVFQFIEHRRVVKGPWTVTFTSEPAAPTLVVNQSTLGIRDVRITFAEEHTTTNAPQVLQFSEGRPVPFDVPFGKCVFLDPLFLPGTVAFEMFGHEIQLMPHGLTIDKVERLWHSGETVELRRPAKP